MKREKNSNTDMRMRRHLDSQDISSENFKFICPHEEYFYKKSAGHILIICGICGEILERRVDI